MTSSFSAARERMNREARGEPSAEREPNTFTSRREMLNKHLGEGEETWGQMFGRQAAGLGARAAETVVGLPGAASQLLHKGVSKVAGLIPGVESDTVFDLLERTRHVPTPYELREKLTAPLSGGYLEPRGAGEEFAHELTEDLAAFAIPIGAPMRVAAKIGIPLAANLGKQTLKSMGFSDTTQDLAKLGIMGTLALSHNADARRYSAGLINEAESMVPEGTRMTSATADIMTTAIDSVKAQPWYQSTIRTAPEGPARKTIEEFMQYMEPEAMAAKAAKEKAAPRAKGAPKEKGRPKKKGRPKGKEKSQANGSAKQEAPSFVDAEMAEAERLLQIEEPLHPTQLVGPKQVPGIELQHPQLPSPKEAPRIEWQDPLAWLNKEPAGVPAKESTAKFRHRPVERQTTAAAEYVPPSAPPEIELGVTRLPPKFGAPSLSHAQVPTIIQMIKQINWRLRNLDKYGIKSKVDRNQAAHYLTQVKNALVKGVEDYGKKYNKRFLESYKKANEAFAVTEQTAKMSRFISENYTGPALSNTTKSLLGIAAVHGAPHLPAAVGIAAATLPPLAAAAQTIKVAQRMVKNPTLRKYYLNVWKDSLRGSAIPMTLNLQKLDKLLREEEEKKGRPKSKEVL
jgi:hypothetical protein